MFLSLKGVFIVCGDWPVSSLDAEQLPLDRTMKDAQPPSVHGSVKLNRGQTPHWTFADFSANRAGRCRTSMSKKQKPRGSREKQRYQRIAKATMATGIMVRKRPAVGFKAAMIDRKSTRLNSSHPSISYAVF